MLVVALTAFVVLLVLRATGVLEEPELAWYDLQLQRASGAWVAAPPIALVLIEEDDIRRFGHPLPDDVLRQLLERLLAADPRVVGVDVYRDQPVPLAKGDPGLDTPAYRELGALVTADPRVVMTMKFPDPGGQGTPPPRFLSGDRQVGFSDLPVDRSGAIRRGLLYMWEGDRPLVSFGLQLALGYLAADGTKLEPDPDNPDHVKLGPTVIAPFRGDQGPYVSADDGGYQFLLDFRWGDRPLDTYRLSSLLAGEVDPSRLRDRIVVVGTAAPSVKDSFFTPLSRVGDPSDRAMYGVEVHAHAAHQLLRYATGESRPLASLGPLAAACWVGFWCLTGAGVGSWNRRLSVLVAALAACAVLLVVMTVVCFDRAIWVPFMPALLGLLGSTAGVVAAGSVLERADRRELLGLFSRFQGRNVADEIWRRRDEFVGAAGRPATRRLMLTTLLADLEGYSGVSEKLDPETLIDWVNGYLSALAEIVEAHGGVVDDYAGDGLKASFGFPIPRDREEHVDADAEAAVRCALAMGRRVEELNARLGEQGLPVSRCRIGVFTGPVVAGFIGSDRALKYATVGDTINTAKRLEEFHKQDFHAEHDETSWRVLIGDETMRRAGDHFEAASIGTHRVRGKAEPIEIFRVVDER